MTIRRPPLAQRVVERLIDAVELYLNGSAAPSAPSSRAAHDEGLQSLDHARSSELAAK